MNDNLTDAQNEPKKSSWKVAVFLVGAAALTSLAVNWQLIKIRLPKLIAENAELKKENDALMRGNNDEFSRNVQLAATIAKLKQGKKQADGVIDLLNKAIDEDDIDFNRLRQRYSNIVAAKTFAEIELMNRMRSLGGGTIECLTNRGRFQVYPFSSYDQKELTGRKLNRINDGLEDGSCTPKLPPVNGRCEIGDTPAPKSFR